MCDENSSLGEIYFGSIAEYESKPVGRIVADVEEDQEYANLRLEVYEVDITTPLRDFITKMRDALQHFNEGLDAMTGLDGRICKIRVEVVRDGSISKIKIGETARKALEFTVDILSCSSARLESTVAA